MKQFILLSIAFLAFLLTSCDGKERSRTSHEENLTNSNLSTSFFVKEHYFPKEYTVIKHDSILSNGFDVSIKITTNQDVTLKKIKKDTITHKNYYRDFDVAIIVKKNDRIVFNHIVNKHFIKNHTELTEAFNDEILNGVWLDEFLSTTQNAVEIALTFCEPKSSDCFSYNLIIDEQGFKIQPLQKHS